MANVPTAFPLTISGLVTSTGVTSNDMGQLVYWRKSLPQPFNTRGIESNRPTSGQMWPRGRE